VLRPPRSALNELPGEKKWGSNGSNLDDKKETLEGRKSCSAHRMFVPGKKATVGSHAVAPNSKPRRGGSEGGPAPDGNEKRKQADAAQNNREKRKVTKVKGGTDDKEDQEGSCKTRVKR